MRRLVELLIDEEDELGGVEAVSLVKFPAIEENFVYLSRQSQRGMRFQLQSEEKQMLIGPALIPNKEIPRIDDATGDEYDVYFSESTVKQAQELFMRQMRTNKHTYEHAVDIEGLTVVESWIIEDPKRDKSALYGFKLPKGTWMMSVKVLNDEVWKRVKDKEVRGFSIEGYFADKIIEMQQQNGCPNCPDDHLVRLELMDIILEETKPYGFLDGEPMFDSYKAATLWSETFNNTKGAKTVNLNGTTMFLPKK